ncbi:MAG: InlB B-repeat-containing protein [Oscillospiraceae bacterium]|nr:InlB B-repeat-containing protein [Oscillospiraceae bacterium]
MSNKRWITSFVALLCLLCMTVGLFAGCGSKGKKIEVVFDMNWKEAASAPESIQVREGKPYGQLPQIAEDVREGYTFGGWYLDSDCDGDEVTAETVVASGVSHVLYAKWIGDKITVSFDLQGGTINGVSNVEDAVVTVGNVYSMMAIPEDPEKENNSFMGWFYDPEGKEGPVRTSTKVEKTEDHTLYAVWQEYQLFYDFENGTGLEVFAAAGNIQYGIQNYNGSDQLNISNPGTDKADGTALQMWIPLKTGTRVTMDLTFAGALPAENARMYMFGYGMNASGIAITDGVLDITQSETHRKWYHGNGHRAMQKDGVWYYGDEGNWHEGSTCRFEMIVMEDCAGLYLMFCLGSELEAAQFAKNNIYIDNIEFTPNYYRVLGDGMMGSSPHGATENGIYFTMKKNDLPYDSDWRLYYDATSANNVKIIRNGRVYRIAQTDCDNIVKFSETDYYLRLEEYTIGPAAPFSNKDIFIVEGDFRYGGHTLTIQKAYIYHDGTSWVFVDQLPEELAPASEAASNFPDPYYGILRSHEGGATDRGIHFKLSDNGLPYGEDWDVYYDATTADNIKVIRDGKVYRAAKIGCDNICKFGKADYYLRLEEYTIGGYWPFTTSDIFIVEGDFVYEESTLKINKTYIYYNGSDWVFTTKLPAELAPETEEPVEPEEIADGVLGSSPNGATDMGIYFTMKDNGLPYGDWNVYYDATTADNIKVIRNGVTYPAAVVGCDNICKFTATDYYLKLENYTIGGYAPFTTADIFVVEGDFTYEDSTLTVVKTYIYHNGTAWVFDTELPEDLKPGEGEGELGNNLGVLKSHSAGVNVDGTGNVTGVYATGAATNAPFNTDWSVEYTPAAAKNYQLIRDGVTYDVGVSGNGTIVLFGQTELYLKQEGHTVGDGTLLPIRDGDILVVKGEWVCTKDASVTVTVEKTCILISEGTATFSAGEPDEDEGEEELGNNLGVLKSHSAGVNVDGTGNVTGVYATGAATNALYNTDWSVEYTPVAAKNYQLIRDGVTYDVGVSGNGTIVLFGQTELYLKQESHTVGDGTLLPIRDGDILVVKGEWVCTKDASVTVTIEKTCILISEGTATFSAGEPDEDEGGEGTEPEDTGLSAHVNGVNIDTVTNSIKGIYATCKENEALFNTDWSVEYTPAAAENYKLIRDGVTYNVGVPGQGTIVLFGQTELYLKQEAHAFGDGTLLPIRDGDILVVEGQWNCIQDASSVLTIEKTYIIVNGNTVTYAAKLPDETLPDDTPTDVQWPFNFDDGQVSTEVFKLRDSDLEMTVEELGGSMQLRLQPTAANGKYWLWLDQELKAGTVITMDVTFQRKLGAMNLYLYGAKENGDPITEGTVSETVPQVWFYGQGVEADFTDGSTNTQTVTFTVYEDCHGIAFMLGYGNKKPNVIYLDNIAQQNAPAEEGNAMGVLLAHSTGVDIDTETNTVKGIYAVGAATSVPFNSDWSVEYTPVSADGFKLIRDGETYSVGVPGSGTLVKLSETDCYLKFESWTVAGDLLPIQDGDVLVVEGEWSCNKDESAVITIDKTYILYENGEATFSAEQP